MIGSVLDRLLEPLADCLTVEAARKMVAARADPADQARIDELGQKANLGTLTDDERADYDRYLATWRIVAIIQAKAMAVVERHADDRSLPVRASDRRNWSRLFWFTAGLALGLSILLGTIVYSIQERHSRFVAAAKHIESNGGAVDWDLPWTPARIRFLQGNVTDEQLSDMHEAFETLYTVGVVEIDSDQLTEKGAVELLAMHSLQHIGLGPSVSEERVKAIRANEVMQWRNVTIGGGEAAAAEDENTDEQQSDMTP
jgi:hypothetical protein